MSPTTTCSSFSSRSSSMASSRSVFMIFLHLSLASDDFRHCVRARLQGWRNICACGWRHPRDEDLFQLKFHIFAARDMIEFVFGQFRLGLAQFTVDVVGCHHTGSHFGSRLQHNPIVRCYEVYCHCMAP